MAREAYVNPYDASLLALMPNGQNPISLENQIYPPAIDTLVIGIARVA